MSTEIVLEFGREPAQVKIAISALNNKSGLRVSVLCCNLLHDLVCGKVGQNTDPCWIASEQGSSKSINMVIRD
jgi:hypothetical protein